MRRPAWSVGSTRKVRKVCVLRIILKVHTAKQDQVLVTWPRVQTVSSRSRLRTPSPKPIRERSLLEPQAKRMTAGWKPSHAGPWVMGRWQMQEHWVYEG